MTEALAFLAAAAICVPIAARLGLGSVLGYLIAGAAIGPWGLAIVGDVEATRHLAELGVVLMLFVIGLELDPRRFLAMRGIVFGGGSAQLALTGGVLAVALGLLGLPWPAALVAGLALGFSSTAISMQTLAERNELDTPTGRSAFGILLFQDIAAIPLIALVPFVGAVHGTGSLPVWERIAIAVAAVAGVVVIGRYLTRPVLRLIAKVDLREVFTAFALFLVIGIADLMAEAGLSMGLGAFLAGVLLAGSEFRHALESDLEPFKGLLLGLFFISVGMTIDFGLFASAPGTVALLLAGFLVLKIATLWAIACGIKLCRHRWLFAFLLSQGSEFAFVVFGVAREARLFDPRWEALLTITVALSMATTPLLLLAYDQLARRRTQAEREADSVEPGGPVIIAGFGRFGQIVGRLLLANGVRAVVLDHDPDEVDSLRKFGYRVYYGDATRLDLLEAAGARGARLLVNAIDDVDASLALVDRVRENFPSLPIVSRARNVSHYFELKLRGVNVVERETFESALRAGRAALQVLGMAPYRAREMADAFRRHNIASVDATLPFYQDEARRMSMAKAGREELERQFAHDRERFEREHGGKGWQ
ncbi:MAG TPA: glutathione-regulated potassium-efflux system protein KefC [Usitatibacter sp.]|jgi:glutathione-regulated potassium-efflux system ancillary protein KefC|nr:glutathione-regulated potassium-efflux system protein KefC [Usitatibacter sp.]